MIFKIKADRVSGTVVLESAAAVVSVPAREQRVAPVQRTHALTVVRGFRIVVEGRRSQISLPVIATRGLKEVFYQDDDPDISYSAINFKTGVFPAHPDVPVMLVNEPTP